MRLTDNAVDALQSAGSLARTQISTHGNAAVRTDPTRGGITIDDCRRHQSERQPPKRDTVAGLDRRCAPDPPTVHARPICRLPVMDEPLAAEQHDHGVDPRHSGVGQDNVAIGPSTND